MVAACLLSLHSPVWHLRKTLCVLLGLGLLLAGCGTSDHHNVTAPTAASPQLEQQAITNLLDLYRQALLQEDIDRLHKLTDSGALLTAMSTAFRTLTMLDFELPAET